MNEIKAKIRRWKYSLKHDFFTVENIVLLLAIVLCLMWTYQSIMAMSRNWQLSEKLTSERRELELLSLETEAAELENEYYKTNEYQELNARRFMDKQMPGEKMVVLPENSAEARNAHIENMKPQEEREMTNIEKWFKFLFPNY